MRNPCLSAIAILVIGTFDSVSGSEAAKWSADVPEAAWVYIVVHHSATDSGSVASIHSEHRQRKDAAGNSWLGIGYHFVIGNGNGMPDGDVVPTFRWKEQLSGAHSGDAVFNTRGIGICLIGNFDKSRPTGRQLAAVKELVRVLSFRHQIPAKRVTGHSSIRPTSCPGQRFPLPEVQAAASDATQG